MIVKKIAVIMASLAFFFIGCLLVASLFDALNLPKTITTVLCMLFGMIVGVFTVLLGTRAWERYTK